jgi:ribosomal protein L19E
MCGAHHGRQRGFGARSFGFRGRGFPSREEWLERLQAHRQQLEDDLKNVQELIERLGSGEQPVSQV